MVVERVKAASVARRSGLTEVGRAEVVLCKEASSVFFREPSHLLAGTRAREVVSRRLFDAEGVRVYDSPGDLRCLTARLFGDEGVATRRRWLVEGGSAVDAHYSVMTACEAGRAPARRTAPRATPNWCTPL